MQEDIHGESHFEGSRSASAHNARLADLIRSCVESWDDRAAVRFEARPDGKLDIIVVSRRFEGLDSRDREAEFWPALEPVPQPEMVFLTYCLLLTPHEAEREFSERPTAPVRAENWDE